MNRAEMLSAMRKAMRDKNGRSLRGRASRIYIPQSWMPELLEHCRSWYGPQPSAEHEQFLFRGTPIVPHLQIDEPYCEYREGSL